MLLIELLLSTNILLRPFRTTTALITRARNVDSAHQQRHLVWKWWVEGPRGSIAVKYETCHWRVLSLPFIICLGIFGLTPNIWTPKKCVNFLNTRPSFVGGLLLCLWPSLGFLPSFSREASFLMGSLISLFLGHWSCLGKVCLLEDVYFSFDCQFGSVVRLTQTRKKMKRIISVKRHIIKEILKKLSSHEHSGIWKKPSFSTSLHHIWWKDIDRTRECLKKIKIYILIMSFN